MKPEDKKTRTVRLHPDIDRRLQALCDHLGTNVNSFLVTKIGEIVSSSELAFVAQTNSNAMLEVLSHAVSDMDDTFKDIADVKMKQMQQMTIDQDD